MQRFVAGLLLGLFASGARAEATDDANPFQKSYLSVEIARNYPVSFTQSRFEPGQYHPVITYRHDLDEDWMMGVGGQFKMLHRIDEPDVTEPSRDLALWTISHETFYVLRLDHPTYLLFGPKIHYFLPTLAAKLPLVKDDEMQTEIGAAASMTLARILNGGGLVTLRADRWRGTRSLKLHGVEVAVGYSYPL